MKMAKLYIVRWIGFQVYFRYNPVHYAFGSVQISRTLADNALFLTVVLSQRHFGRGALINNNDYFSTKVCELGLHFGTKSSCSSNTQIL